MEGRKRERRKGEGVRREERRKSEKRRGSFDPRTAGG